MGLGAQIICDLTEWPSPLQLLGMCIPGAPLSLYSVKRRERHLPSAYFHVLIRDWSVRKSVPMKPLSACHSAQVELCCSSTFQKCQTLLTVVVYFLLLLCIHLGSAGAPFCVISLPEPRLKEWLPPGTLLITREKGKTPQQNQLTVLQLQLRRGTLPPSHVSLMSDMSQLDNPRTGRYNPPAGKGSHSRACCALQGKIDFLTAALSTRIISQWPVDDWHACIGRTEMKSSFWAGPCYHRVTKNLQCLKCCLWEGRRIGNLWKVGQNVSLWERKTVLAKRRCFCFEVSRFLLNQHLLNLLRDLVIVWPWLL